MLVNLNKLNNDNCNWQNNFQINLFYIFIAMKISLIVV